MAEDWAADVRKYAPDADEVVIQGIVRYCGIALRSRDASLVSFTEKAELDRVRENFLKKKLGLTEPDDVLDAAIAAVGERMQGDPTKNRVTVYYLLAERFGKLGLFASASGATDADPSPAATEGDPDTSPARLAELPPMSPPAAAEPSPQPSAGPSAAATGAAAIAAAPASRPGRDDGVFGTAFWTLGVVGLGILGAATLGGASATSSRARRLRP